MVDPKSDVYTATYSGIQVFEMSVGDSTLMRRRSDSYLNATQILKLGGLDKGKRTKVLEREVLSKTHEKIQGGYGKYQGTWVPLEIGRDLAERYDVLHLLLPLLDFDTSTWSDLPEKEQMPPRNSRTRINQDRLSQPQPQTTPPSSPSHPSQQNTLTLTDSFKRKIAPIENDENGLARSAETSTTALVIPDTKKRNRVQLQPKQKLQPSDSGSSNSLVSAARPTIISKKDDGNDTDTEQHRNNLLSIFSSNDDIIPSFFYGSGATTGIDWDITIDEQGHTALHWSVSLGWMHTVEWLIAKGANVGTVNSVGETALMRGVMATLIYDHDCFAHMLDVLRESFSLADYAGRTVLHHIILSTLESKTTANLDAISSSTSSSSNRYKSSVPSTPTSDAPSPPTSSTTTAATAAASQQKDRLLAAKSYMTHALKVIGLHSEHFHILNKPDKSGETPYNLACRLNCTDLCYLMEQSGCSLDSDDTQFRKNVPSFLALPPPIPDKSVDHSPKRSRKKGEKKHDKQNLPVENFVCKSSSSGQELVSTVQRIVDAMELEFKNKLQAKEADISRLQQELLELTRQLENVQQQRNSFNKNDADQLEQANLKIKQLENILSKSRIKNLDIGTGTVINRQEGQLLSTSLSTTCGIDAMTDRERELEQQITLLQSKLMETNKNNTQEIEVLTQTHAKTLESLVACRRLIATCCNLPLDVVDDFIGPLTLAIENDSPDLDFARVIGFMEKLRQHQQ